MIQFDNCVERFGKIILTELTDAKITCWVAGGSVRDYFMGVKIATDYDLFFPNQKEFNKAANYLTNGGAEVKWESDNGMKVKYNGKTFDLVKHFFSTPLETINAFDFTVSMFAVNDKEVFHGQTSFIDLSKRQLMINKITYPASTMSRAFRYYKKGFSMCIGEMAKLVESIQNMPKIEVDESDETEKSSMDMASIFTGID